MAQIALFHSVLGLRPGMYDAARRLTEAGHEVRLVDQYGGEIFDDYDEALAFAETIGMRELMARAIAATADLDDGFLVAGWSNGAGMAEFVATRRLVGGAVLFAGAMALHFVGATAWPAGVPAQVHTTIEDPWREQDQIDEFAASVRAADGTVAVFDYAGAGHLFTDASMAQEYDEVAAERAWNRVLEFCARR